MIDSALENLLVGLNYIEWYPRIAYSKTHEHSSPLSFTEQPRLGHSMVCVLSVSTLGRRSQSDLGSKY